MYGKNQVLDSSEEEAGLHLRNRQPYRQAGEWVSRKPTRTVRDRAGERGRDTQDGYGGDLKLLVSTEMFVSGVVGDMRWR